MLYVKILDLESGSMKRLAFRSLGQLLADDRMGPVDEALGIADFIQWDENDLPARTERFRLPYGDVEEDVVFGLGSTPDEATRAFHEALTLLNDEDAAEW